MTLDTSPHKPVRDPGGRGGGTSRPGPEAREVLNAILDKYAEHGVRELVVPDVLEVPPLSSMGNVLELAKRFGGEENLAAAVRELQAQLYAA